MIFHISENIVLKPVCCNSLGSFSRSAVNFMAGCRTPVSNVVMSMVVLLTLLVITPLFKYTPNAILGSIIISAVIGLVDYEAAILIWKVDKMDFIACMGAFFGVVFKSVEIGLLIAVSTHPSLHCTIFVGISETYLTFSIFIGVNLIRQNPSSSNKTKDCTARKPSRHHNLQEH